MDTMSLIQNLYTNNQWTTSPRKRAGLANYYVVTHCEGFNNTWLFSAVPSIGAPPRELEVINSALTDRAYRWLCYVHYSLQPQRRLLRVYMPCALYRNRSTLWFIWSKLAGLLRVMVTMQWHTITWPVSFACMHRACMHWLVHAWYR